MKYDYLNRYKMFMSDDNYKNIPGIKLREKNSDIIIPYIKNKDRFDILSQKYYHSPYFGWLIMLANQNYGGIEFLIPNNSKIRIPFPLKETLNEYIENIDEYLKLYVNE